MLNYHEDGEWEKVAETYVGLKGSKSFFETKDFLIDPAAPSSLTVQLNIKISGKYKNYNCFGIFPGSRNHPCHV